MIPNAGCTPLALAYGSRRLREPRSRLGLNTITQKQYIHNVGVEYTGAKWAYLGADARKTTISHKNEIGDLPYTGISFWLGGLATPTRDPWTPNPNIQATSKSTTT